MKIPFLNLYVELALLFTDVYNKEVPTITAAGLQQFLLRFRAFVYRLQQLFSDIFQGSVIQFIRKCYIIPAWKNSVAET